MLKCRVKMSEEEDADAKRMEIVDALSELSENRIANELFNKKCPKCGKRLATKEYFCCRYYRCSCGYEYATEIGRI